MPQTDTRPEAAPETRIKWRHRITVRLILVMSVFSTLIFGATLGYNYYQARQMIEAKIRIQARDRVAAAAGKLETVIGPVTLATEAMARAVGTFSHKRGQLLDFMKASLLAEPNVYGIGVISDPSTDRLSHKTDAPYFYRASGEIRQVNLCDNFNCWTQDWWQIPKALGKAVWTEPYYDESGGKTLMATCAVPFYIHQNGRKRFGGIVGADISLNRLTHIVSAIRVLKTGYGFLLSKNGVFLAHPRKSLIMNESIFSIAEERGSKTLRKIGRRMTAGKSGFVPYKTVTGVQSWLYFAPLKNVGWTLAVVFPKNELMADTRMLTMTMAGIGFAGILLLTLALVLIARSITHPIRTLATASGRIAAGEFDAPLPRLRSKGELGVLAHDFRVMRDSLKDHIRQLKETTAARERIESELKIAHDIQMSILPKTFPPFPNREEFDLFALIAPAREVGGDFYDFFQISENRLCFVIGDVSGKGVPAALFMAVTKTLIKSFAREGVTPAAILSHVNEELSSENDSCMFVTLFCGVLDTDTGEIQYANAGHNPPLLVRKNGDVEWLPRAGAIMAGPMPGVVYECERLSLSSGDSLFLYTDGVTEAMNLSDELFSEERLEKNLAVSADMKIRDAIENIMSSIRGFTDGAPQSDDITMMMIRYSGGGKNL